MNSSEIGQFEELKRFKMLLFRELAKLEKKQKKQHHELQEASNYFRYQQIGDSLNISPQSAPRGTVNTFITNVHTEAEEEVTLNPKLNAKENAALYFKKAKKGKRGEEICTKKAEATAAAIEELQKAIAPLEAVLQQPSETQGQIAKAIAGATAALTPYLPKQSLLNTAPTTTSQYTNPLPYRHFHTEGWDIYLGKTDAQNDEISTRFAAPADLWFHVAGHAGSHVIIRRPKGKPMPPQSIMRTAAALAVWFSKAKHTSFAEVNMTEARFVRKRRHAPAGEVIAERCKSLRVAPKSPQELFEQPFLTE